MHKEALLNDVGPGVETSEAATRLRQAAFWALCAFAFAEGIEDALPDPPGPISGEAVFGAVAFVCWLGALILDPARNKVSWTWAHLFGALFILWILISNPDAALFGDNRNWVLSYGKLWVAMLLTVALVRREFDHRALLWCVAAGGAVSAIVARSEVIVRDTVDTSLRSGGLSLGPNEGARLYVIAFVIFVVLGANAGSRAVRVGSAVGAGAVLAGLGATMSRSGLLLAILAIVMLIVVALRSQRRLILRLLAAGLALGALTIPFDYWSVVPPSIVDTDPEGTLVQRFQIWQGAVEMIEDRPVTGVGVDRFAGLLDEYAPDSLPEWARYRVPHNNYIGLLAEVGVVGLLLFAALAGFATYRLLQRIRAGPLTPAGYTWVIVFVITMLGGLVIYTPYDALMWMTFGALLTLPTSSDREAVPAD